MAGTGVAGIGVVGAGVADALLAVNAGAALADAFGLVARRDVGSLPETLSDVPLVGAVLVA